MNSFLRHLPLILCALFCLCECTEDWSHSCSFLTLRKRVCITAFSPIFTLQTKQNDPKSLSLKKNLVLVLNDPKS